MYILNVSDRGNGGHKSGGGHLCSSHFVVGFDDWRARAMTVPVVVARGTRGAAVNLPVYKFIVGNFHT